MKCVITIQMDNAAFDDDKSELARILLDVATKQSVVLAFPCVHPLMDINGNVVGRLRIIDDSKPKKAPDGFHAGPEGFTKENY